MIEGRSYFGDNAPLVASNQSGLQPLRTLEDLAASAALSMSDVAFLSEVTKSTLSRLWSDNSWLDKISGTNLQSLLATVPGLSEYVALRSRARRIDEALQQCVEAGLDVSLAALRALARNQSSGFYIAIALSAAANVMQQDYRSAYARLTRCWGAQPDVALDALFSSGSDSLLPNSASFITRATRMVEANIGGANSLQNTVGSGILVHKLTKITGTSPVTTSYAGRQRNSVFAYRSFVIGLILNSDDVDSSSAYCENLESSPLLNRNEIWSMASYSGDLMQSPDFRIPLNVALPKTAKVIIGDFDSKGEAYLHYLVTSAIPAVLACDRGFGDSVHLLAKIIKQRMDRGISDRRVRAECGTLLKNIS